MRVAGKPGQLTLRSKPYPVVDISLLFLLVFSPSHFDVRLVCSRLRDWCRVSPSLFETPFVVVANSWSLPWKKVPHWNKPEAVWIFVRSVKTNLSAEVVLLSELSWFWLGWQTFHLLFSEDDFVAVLFDSWKTCRRFHPTEKRIHSFRHFFCIRHTDFLWRGFYPPTQERRS